MRLIKNIAMPTALVNPIGTDCASENDAPVATDSARLIASANVKGIDATIMKNMDAFSEPSSPLRFAANIFNIDTSAAIVALTRMTQHVSIVILPELS